MQTLRKIFFILVVCPYMLMAQSATNFPEDIIDMKEVEKHIRFLASDDLMGRRTGTPGNDAAARYIAEQFQSYGLSTVPGADNYYQNVPFERTSPAANARLTILDNILKPDEELIVMGGGAIEKNAPVVFAGYGISDPETGMDDYKGLDVKGKIVVVRLGMPGNDSPRESIRKGTSKRKTAAKHGAVALVELYNIPFPWRRITGFLNRPRMGLATGSTDNPVPEIPHLWINDTEGNYLAALEKSSDTKASIMSTGFIRDRSVTSKNVIGIVQGNDPNLKNEYVLLMAHYDHVGTGMQAGPGATPADTIFNGARDNGIGTVAIISAAKTLSQKPPARSVIIMAVTAEEMGLLGSAYYTQNPLIPLKQTVFVLNSDGAGYTDKSITTVVGLERTTARSSIETACADYGLGAIADPVPEQNLFDRSDNVNFAQKGVPAPTMSPGFRAFDEELMRYYHRPQDEADNLDYDYVTRFCKAFARAARLVADDPNQPQWIPGDKYEEAGKMLYGKE